MLGGLLRNVYCARLRTRMMMRIPLLIAVKVTLGLSLAGRAKPVMDLSG